MPDAPSLIYLHAPYRSGSTFVFKAFREQTDYVCFQEPIHEIAVLGRDDPDLLETLLSPEDIQALRHPPLKAPYHQELKNTHSAWAAVIQDAVVYSKSFDTADQSDTVDYLQAIRGAAGSHVFFQDCRSVWRISSLKAGLGGIHLGLWRHPWAQWWSMKATPYFETALLMAINADTVPPVIDRLRKAISFERCDMASISDQLAFYGQRRQAPEPAYLTFFTLWCVALLQMDASCDAVISIDQLSVDDTYKKTTGAKLAALGIPDLDFTGANIPQMQFVVEEASFFQALEGQVFDWLLEAGVSKTRIDALRRKAKYKAAKSGPRSAPTGEMAQIEQTRRTVLAIETREANLLQAQRSEHVSMVMSLNEKASEIGVLRAELDAKASEVGGLRNELDAKASEVGGLRNELDAKANEAGVAQNDLASKAAEVGVLREELEAKAAEIGVLRAEQDRQAETMTDLQTQLALARSDARQRVRQALITHEAQEHLQARLDGVISAHETTQGQLRSIEADRDAVIETMAKLEAELAEAARHMDRHLAQTHHAHEVEKLGLKTDIAALRAEEDRLHRLVQDMTAERGRILGSLSWRFTWPLRAVRGAVVKLTGANAAAAGPIPHVAPDPRPARDEDTPQEATQKAAEQEAGANVTETVDAPEALPKPPEQEPAIDLVSLTDVQSVARRLSRLVDEQ